MYELIDDKIFLWVCFWEIIFIGFYEQAYFD